MELLMIVASLIGGIALLIFSANWLVESAVTISRALGLSTLWVGLTVVAFGTSAPELAVNLLAAIDGHPDLAFGNVMGSNIANIGLVVGLAAVMAPIAVHSRVVKRELPLLVAISLGACGLAFLPATRVDGEPGFSRIDGIVMLVVFAAFFIWWTISARTSADDLLEQEDDLPSTAPPRQWLPWVIFVASLIGLIGGAKLTQHSAVELARMLNVSEAIIGLSIVALATSLPEVVTVLVAVRKGHTDLAVGNVVGSNVFNLLLVLACTSTITNIALPEGAGIDLVVMVVMTTLLWLVSTTNGQTVRRIEGIFLLALYVGYIGWRAFG